MHIDNLLQKYMPEVHAKLKAYNIHLAIFCSPHNPTGRVREKWEIEKAMEVYAANNCYVISDEIWADIVFADHKHIPTQMACDWARENVVAVYAPSKTFNLAVVLFVKIIVSGRNNGFIAYFYLSVSLTFLSFILFTEYTHYLCYDICEKINLFITG